MRLTATIIILVSALVICVPVAKAESLLVTTDGKSLWVKSISTEGQWLYCKSLKTGEKRSFQTSEIDGIVQRVERGSKYPAAQIDKALGRLKRLFRQHPRLGKQLRMLQQEWEALRKPATDLEGTIADYVEEFDMSERTPKDYQNTAVKLDMLRFKDVAGRYADEIQSAIDDMKKDFVAISTGRLEKKIRNGPRSIDNYAECHDLVEGMKLASLDADTAEGIEAIQTRYRREILKKNLDRARSVFLRDKSIDTYLQSSATLDDLMKKVADSSAERKEIKKQAKTLRTAAGQSLDNYIFDFEGYPLHVSDSRFLAYGWSSKINLHMYRMDEHCFMFPRNRPRKVVPGTQFGVPYRLVFNRDVPADREYYLVCMFYLPGQPSKKHVKALGKLDIKDGRADVGFGMKLPELPDDYELPDGDQKPGLCIFVAYKRSGAGREDSDRWVAASLACPIPLGM